MKGLPAGFWLVLVLSCSDGGDGVVEGTTAECAYGGELANCPPAERTPEGACWRLVDCDRIPVDSDGDDWGTCVDGLDGLTSDVRRLVIDCIATSTCDELRVSNHCGKPGDL